MEIVLTKETAFDFNSSEYASLYRESRATAFQAPLWLAGIHNLVMPSTGAEPVTITGRSGDGRLVLVVPLMRRRHRGLYRIEFAGSELCDYQRAVYRPSDTTLLQNDPTLAQRISWYLMPCDLIRLDKLDGNDHVLRALFPRAHQAVMRVGTYPSILGQEWEPWRSSNMDQDFRRYLDKTRRKLGRSGELHFCQVDEEDELTRIFESARSFRASRFKELGACDITAHDGVFGFYRKTAIEGVHQGTASTFCLYIDRRPIAVMFGPRDDRTFWLVWVAFDTTQYRKYSVGLLATEDAIRTCIQMGLSIFDFTIGDHPYKLQFGGKKYPLFEWHIPTSIPGCIGVVGIGVVREAKRVLRPWLKGSGSWGKPARSTIRDRLAAVIKRHLNLRHRPVRVAENRSGSKRAGRYRPDQAKSEDK
jgi:CelD/BcsL family acetyltransferase involved in cellulose biosynthesis